MKEYILYPAKLFPLGEGQIRLETNDIYIKLLELKKELNDARDSMEPYFQNYGSLFRSITSNFGSFKSTRFHISKRFNTPSVSNSWIIMYEIISRFDLISDDDTRADINNKKFIHISFHHEHRFS